MFAAAGSPHNAPGQLLPLYPMTVADILDGAFRTWRAVVAASTVVVLLVTGPLEILAHLALYQRAPELLLGTTAFDDAAALDFGGIGLMILLGLIGAIAGVYAAATVLVLVVDADQGRQTPLGGAFLAAMRPAGVALVALLLVALAAMGAMIAAVVIALIPIAGLLALLFGGPVVMGVFVAVGALIAPIAVLERRGPIETLGRAIWVLRVRFWRTIGITWLVLIVLTGVALGASFLVDMLALATGPAAWIVMAVGQLLISVVQLPVVSLAALMVLLDARIVNEGYDLEVRTSRLAAA